MAQQLEFIGCTVWRVGECCSIVGVIGDGVGIVSLGRCTVPAGVGAKGGKLARIAKKLARARALRHAAKTALQKADTATNASTATQAIKAARAALEGAQRLERSARDEYSAPERDEDESDDE